MSKFRHPRLHGRLCVSTILLAGLLLVPLAAPATADSAPSRYTFSASPAPRTVSITPLAIPGTATAQQEFSCSIRDFLNFDGTYIPETKQVVNGTWNYGTAVACSINLTDMAFELELKQNGTRVNSDSKGFTNQPRSYDTLTSGYFCLFCNGNWLAKYGQLLQAPPGFTWNPAPGCTLITSEFLACIQQIPAQLP